MYKLTCIPPSKDATRAAALVPQKYVDEMFLMAERELQEVLDVGVLGAEVYRGSPATCKWLNSELYLNEFVEGLRGRTDGVMVDLSDTYKEALERLPHTNQLPSWMRHELSYKRQLYTLATHDAVERLYARFEALGSGHCFVAMAQDSNGLTGRPALNYYIQNRESRRNTFRSIREAGFWPKRLVKEIQNEMYDQTLRAFLGRSRFATALGDYSRMYRQNWVFDDAESLRYKAPRVLHPDALNNALDMRRRELGQTENARDRGECRTGRLTRAITPVTEAVENVTEAVENFGVQAGNMILPEGWTDETAHPEELSPPEGSVPSEESADMPMDVEIDSNYEQNASDESAPLRNACREVTNGMVYETTAGHDRQAFDRTQRASGGEYVRAPSSGSPWRPMTQDNYTAALSEANGGVRFEMPDPSPSDLDLRARITRVAAAMNVPESQIEAVTRHWDEYEMAPNHVLSEPQYHPQTRTYSARVGQARPAVPQSNINSGQIGSGTISYEII